MMMNKKKPFSLHLDVDSFMPATAEEKEVISRMRPSSTFFRDGVKRLLKNKVATISLILIVLITLSSIIIPMFWPYSYDQMLGQTKGRPKDNSSFLLLDINELQPAAYTVVTGTDTVEVEKTTWTEEELNAMTVEKIKGLAAYKGYAITKTTKSEVIAEFLAAQTAATA